MSAKYPSVAETPATIFSVLESTPSGTLRSSATHAPVSESSTTNPALYPSPIPPKGATPAKRPHARSDTSSPSFQPICTGCKPATGHCRCPPPPPGKEERNLVVCIDGTAQQIGMFNTHVVELYSMLENSEKQFTYYTSGVGSYVSGASFFTRLKQKIIYGTDIAFALDHEKNILHAYEWLCNSYSPGDHIYIFGFSRGAYQARIISELVECVGLLRRNNTNQIPFAFRQYLRMKETILDKLSRRHPKREFGQGLDDIKKVCEQFKRLLSHPGARVHFLGAWDTVASIGLAQGPRYVLKGMLHVCACRHGLGLHEKRVKYLPEYFQSGLGSLASVGGNVKEVWFSGCHSDIGGGNLQSKDPNSAGPALQWMLYEAMDYGIIVRPFQRQWGVVTHHPSMNLLWWILELYPVSRLSYNAQDYNATTRRSHLAEGRRVQRGQLLHISAKDHLTLAGKGDKSHNRTGVSVVDERDVSTVTPLEDYLDRFETEGRLEVNSHHHVVTATIQALRDAVKNNQVSEDNHAQPHAIQALLNCPVGRQSLIDSLHNEKDTNFLIKALELTSQKQSLTLSGDVECLQSCTITEHRKEIANILSKVLANFYSRPPDSPRRLARQIWTDWEFANAGVRDVVTRTFCSDKLYGRGGITHAVAWSQQANSSNEIVSASQDSSIQLWDAQTCQSISGPLFGHEQSVLCVVFSPADGQRIISCSADGTIQIWDLKELKTLQPRSPVKHARPVRTVSISKDSKYIAYASDDILAVQLLCIDLVAGNAVSLPMRLGVHKDIIWSVSFSPSATYIASGSVDKKIRIFTMKSRQTSVVDLEGHTDTVTSVVFSEDEKRVISGSLDRTIKIWGMTQSGSADWTLLLSLDNVDHPNFTLIPIVAAASARAAAPTHDAPSTYDEAAPVHNAAPTPDTAPDHNAFPAYNTTSVYDTTPTYDGSPTSAPVRAFAIHYRTKQACMLASASEDSAVRLWEIGEQAVRFIGTLKGDHHGQKAELPVHSVSFSPSGSQIVSGSEDGILRIWEIGEDLDNNYSQKANSGSVTNVATS